MSFIASLLSKISSNVNIPLFFFSIRGVNVFKPYFLYFSIKLKIMLTLPFHHKAFLKEIIIYYFYAYIVN